MVRPPIRTNCWLFIISGIALLLCVLSPPIGTQKAAHARAKPNFRSRKLALTSATRDGAIINADRSAIIEEDEDKSFHLFSYLVSRTLIAPDGPPRVLSDPLPGNSPSRTVALPLRC